MNYRTTFWRSSLLALLSICCLGLIVLTICGPIGVGIGLSVQVLAVPVMYERYWDHPIDYVFISFGICSIVLMILCLGAVDRYFISKMTSNILIRCCAMASIFCAVQLMLFIKGS